MVRLPSCFVSFTHGKDSSFFPSYTAQERLLKGLCCSVEEAHMCACVSVYLCTDLYALPFLQDPSFEYDLMNCMFLIGMLIEREMTCIVLFPGLLD